jgi:hypothetical protein
MINVDQRMWFCIYLDPYKFAKSKDSSLPIWRVGRIGWKLIDIFCEQEFLIFGVSLNFMMTK